VWRGRFAKRRAPTLVVLARPAHVTKPSSAATIAAMPRPPVVLAVVLAPVLTTLAACLEHAGDAPPAPEPAVAAVRAPASPPAARLHDVMESAFCAGCHPDIYAEHEQSTHGRAFTDEEVRLATARFAHQDCIVCHTPRPIFETGVGQNPKRRHYGLAEGNTCMTCHWRPDYDYAAFEGGAQCRDAFHPDVGTVEACASCHRNHGTPYQWEASPTGKATGRTCIDCHMAPVERPVAVGGPVREVHPHTFPGARNVAHVNRAYRYAAELAGDHVVVRVENKGAGHNFPTELKQRSVESLVVVRDLEGREVARSRMVFRDPYKRPYGLELPVNTQIPGGATREHRVPLGVAAGTVETTLFFKLYYPIDDFHPDMARVLESRRLPFHGVTPSSEPVVSEPEVAVITPEGISPETASVANMADYNRPKIGTVAVEIPSGSSPADIARLIELFQFPVPQANGEARERLAALGLAAMPALIDALSSWDNKTYNQAMQVLEKIGAPVRPALVAALDDPRLYVRIHARELLVKTLWSGPEIEAALGRGLTSDNAYDRASAAQAAGAVQASSLAPRLRAALSDADPDVVRNAALALAHLGAAQAIPELEAAHARAHYAETRRDLAYALGRLGSTAGVLTLLGGLDHDDDLVREAFFELFFALTGEHRGYEPLAPRPERLAALAELQAWWAREGAPAKLRPFPRDADPIAEAHAWKLVNDIGGNDMVASTPEKDAALEEELVGMGKYAVPALVRGLKYPPGFAEKRAALCRMLGRVGDGRAAPALAATLRDPVVSVAAWACWALEGLADPATQAALVRYEQRLRTLIASDGVPPEAGPGERLLAQAARARLALGDESARHVLAALLIASDDGARRLAFEALLARYGEDRGYDPAADEASRRKAAARWME
jgi:HEAT repeat protein